MADERERFTVELRDLGGSVPAAIRLRALLKRALRSFNLRCEVIRRQTGQAVEALDPGQQPGGNGAAGRAQGLDQGGQPGGSEGPPGQAQGSSPAS